MIPIVLRVSENTRWRALYECEFGLVYQKRSFLILPVKV
jgi:hypothetical protein